MRLFKHPIHLMLVHFPAAFIPMDFVCYGGWYFTQEPSLAAASYYALLGTVLLGWPAVFFGALDLLLIPQEKTETMKKAFLHGGINICVILVYTVLAYISFKIYPTFPEATLPLLVFKGILVGLLTLGNYLGGSLVLRDKIGLEK